MIDSYRMSFNFRVLKVRGCNPKANYYIIPNTIYVISD